MVERTPIDIVIVNWNSGDLLARCLTSIEETSASAPLDITVIVVDNGSEDGSASRYNGALPVTRIENPANEGFARACNQGAAAGTAEFILFLNPDARLIPGGLEVACSFLQSDKGAGYGICGLQLLNDKGQVSRTCARFPTPTHLLNDAVGLSHLAPGLFPGVHRTAWDHRESRAVDHVIGAVYLLRRHLFERVSGFDEAFFVYLEDLDLSYRIKKAGFGSYYLADAQAYHAGGGVSKHAKGLRLFYSLRSRILYADKHHASVPAFLVLSFTLAAEPVARLLQLSFHRDWKAIRELIRGYRLLWRWVLFHREEPRAHLS